MIHLLACLVDSSTVCMESVLAEYDGVFTSREDLMKTYHAHYESDMRVRHQIWSGTKQQQTQSF
jgi:hypothetical protein